jgi:hypothetical protein
MMGILGWLLGTGDLGEAAGPLALGLSG